MVRWLYGLDMAKKRAPEHPFMGESMVLAGTRDILGEKYRLAIENNWKYRQYIQRMEATPTTPVVDYSRADTEWMQRGACRGTVGAGLEESGTFFPEDNESKRNPRFKDYCGACPVAEACEAFARQHRFDGIWGGKYFIRGRESILRPQGNPTLAHVHAKGATCGRCAADREAGEGKYREEPCEASSGAVVTS